MSTAGSVLAKKIGLGGVGRSPIPDIEGLGDIFAKEIEQAFRPVLSAQIAAMVMDAEVAHLPDVNESIPAPSCIGVLTFPGAQYKAMINFDADLIYHIVDLRMGGDPGTCPMPTTRSLTGIDMALCEELLLETIWGFERSIEQQLSGPLGSHFSLADRVQNVSSANIAPETADVLRISVALDIGIAARSGNLDIVVPLSVLDLVRSAVQAERPDTAAITVKDIWLERMKRAVNEAELPLTAVLAKPELPTDTLNNLQVGDFIPLPKNTPHTVKLMMSPEEKNSYTIAEARLGSFEGRKVLKLNGPVDPNVVRSVVKSTSDD